MDRQMQRGGQRDIGVAVTTPGPLSMRRPSTPGFKKQDLPGNNERAGEDMTATADDRRRRLRLVCLQGDRSGQKKAGGVSKQLIKYMRRHSAALIDVQHHCREEWMEGGGDKAANPCRRITARAINATTATPPQQRRRSNTTVAPGVDKRTGGARGRPRCNVDATCQRMGHRTTQPTPPVDAQAINTDSSSATATTKRNRGTRVPSTLPM